MKLYRYDHSLKEDFELTKTSCKHSDYILRYMSPYNSGTPENDQVYSEIKISGDKNPFIIFIHGFGSRLKKLQNYYYFMDNLNEEGYNTVFFNLPYHLHRTPEKEDSGRRLVSFDDVNTLYFFHQAIVDIKKLVNIISYEWGSDLINIIGISLGCMVSTLALATENRLAKGVLLIGGGNWHEIHWNGFLKMILKSNCLKDDIITKKKCADIYKNFGPFVEELGKNDISDLDLDLENNPELREKTTKRCFLCDPAAWGQFVDPDKVLMINSRFDHYFNRRSSRQLWRSIGKPEILWLGKLHSSNILKNEKIFKKMLKFLSTDQ